MMKIVAYIVLLIGVVALVDAGMEQMSGHAKAMSPGRSFHINEANREEHPEEYRNLMSYQWIRAATIMGAGVCLISLIRKADRLDPFSPSFQGGKEIDKLAEHLDKKRTE